jgi:ABC-2 type transport system permease protein
MHTLGLVIRHELKSTASKRSFWLMTLLFPLLITAISLGPQLLARRSVESELNTAADAVTNGSQPLGYVDASGLIQQLPPDLNPAALRAYTDEDAARAAVRLGEISGYFLVPADYLRSGSAVLVTPELSLMTAGDRSGQLDYVLRYNLAGDANLASLLRDPTPAVVATALAPTPSAAETTQRGPAASFLPVAVMFILFFVITMSASYMLQSVVKEKENRTAEVLLVSLHPRDLMLGKVIGLGFLALGQMAIWLVGGMLLSAGGSGLTGLLRNPQASAAIGQGTVPAGLGLPPGFAIWAVLFFLGGYVVYSSALGALGALAPNMREGSQFTFIFLIPLLTPVWLNYVFTEQPHGPLATILSLFPLTAPTAMVARLAAGGVPFWQAALSLVGLAVTAYFFIHLAARFFRADTLLSSGSLSWRRIGSELRGTR